MTRVSESAVSIGHEGVRAPVRVVVGRVGSAGQRDEVGEGHAVEGAGDRVADADPQDVDRAAGRAVAQRGVLGVVGGAHHRGDRALEGAEDLAHPDLGGVAGELVAAVGASRRDDEAGVAEAHHQLLEIRPGEVLLGRDLRERGRPLAEMPAELNHEPDAVLALRRERDGAAAVEGRAGCRVGQGTVLNPE